MSSPIELIGLPAVTAGCAIFIFISLMVASFNQTEISASSNFANAKVRGFTAFSSIINSETGVYSNISRNLSGKDIDYYGFTQPHRRFRYYVITYGDEGERNVLLKRGDAQNRIGSLQVPVPVRGGENSEIIASFGG